jgi:hypothetical protein
MGKRDAPLELLQYEYPNFLQMGGPSGAVYYQKLIEKKWAPDVPPVCKRPEHNQHGLQRSRLSVKNRISIVVGSGGATLL